MTGTHWCLMCQFLLDIRAELRGCEPERRSELRAILSAAGGHTRPPTAQARELMADRRRA